MTLSPPTMVVGLEDCAWVVGWLCISIFVGFIATVTKKIMIASAMTKRIVFVSENAWALLFMLGSLLSFSEPFFEFCFIYFYF